MAQSFPKKEKVFDLKSEMNKCLKEALLNSSDVTDQIRKATVLSDQLDSSRAKLLEEKNAELAATKAKLQDYMSKMKAYLKNQKQKKVDYEDKIQNEIMAYLVLNQSLEEENEKLKKTLESTKSEQKSEKEEPLTDGLFQPHGKLAEQASLDGYKSTTSIVAQYQAKLENISKQYSQVQMERDELKMKLEELDKKQDSYKAKVMSYEEESEILQRKLTEARRHEEELNSKYESAANTIEQLTKHQETLKKDLMDAKREQEELNSKYQSAVSTIERLEKDQESLKVNKGFALLTEPEESESEPGTTRVLKVLVEEDTPPKAVDPDQSEAERTGLQYVINY